MSNNKPVVLLLAGEIAVATAVKFLAPLVPTCVTAGTVAITRPLEPCANAAVQIRILFKPTETNSAGGMFAAFIR